MRCASVHDFRDKASHIFRSRQPVLVLRHGRVVGIFLPQIGDDLPVDLRRQVFQALTSDVARQLKKSRVTKDAILADFKKSRRVRRR